MKIVIRVANKDSAGHQAGKRNKRLNKAFSLGMQSAYDWSGSAGKNFVKKQMDHLKAVINV